MMAQGDNIQITSHTTNNQRAQNSTHFKGPKAQKSPTFQQILQSDDSKWSRISSQIMKNNHDQEVDANRHNKKSVLAKVKEKAKKWKIYLSRKKYSEKNESQCPEKNESRCPVTRSCGVAPKNKREEDTEYHSARFHESKQNNTQSLASVSGKHLEKPNTKQNKDEHASFSNTTEPHFKTHAPSDPSAAAAAADTDTDTKNQTSTTMDVPKALKVSTSYNSLNKSDRSFEDGENTKGESQTPDKGVLVKEYLLHKFEPGEEERTLSKVITQAISPRSDKMREAMSSFLKSDESSSNADNNVNLNLKSKSLPAASTNLNTNNTPIKQSHSFGSSASKASMNLNQTFKSTFASYRDHFLSSSSKRDTNVPGSNQSLNRLNSPLGHGSGANETQAPAQKSRVPSHTATSVRRVPVSRAKVPSHIETNTIQVSPSARTDCNATRTPLSTGDQGGFRV